MNISIDVQSTQFLNKYTCTYSHVLKFICEWINLITKEKERDLSHDNNTDDDVKSNLCGT